MKLLVFSRFRPSLGGLETVMEILAAEWVGLEQEIQVATDVPADASGHARPFPFPVHHRPSPGQLLRLVRWCDVYLQGCVGLKTLWPLLLCRRKYVAAHHIWYRRADGRRGWQDRVKLAVSRRAVNIAPSRAIADDLETACTVIPNPYRENLFKLRPEVPRDRSLLFVGRLVSDKGADLLLSSLVFLKEKGVRTDLTIVGGGPELPSLQRFVAAQGLEAQVTFAGSQPAEEVAVLMNRHRLLVIPSRWAEPFGVVAVEGIASGCLVLGSERGGLIDAIGPCGRTFPNGDMRALATRIEELLDPAPSGKLAADVREDHLAIHRPATVARRYLQVIQP